MEKRIYVVAGELSGDMHGAGLLEELRKISPEVEIRGAGGPAMKRLADRNFSDWLEQAAVMGIWEVLKRYGYFRERFHAMLAEVEAFRPQVLLLIDYPGFNLRFAEAMKRKLPDTKIVYYISPQVWAWKKGRIPKMVRLIDELMCLFPFERDLLSAAGLKTTFVGHPLVDELEAERLPGDPQQAGLVGLFPGSREHEVARLFPLMIEVAKLLRTEFPEVEFETAAASENLDGKIRALLGAAGVNFVNVRRGGSHALMQQAECGVIASGTATLEAAYYGLPYCLVYRVAPLTYALAKVLVKIKLIGIVNILAGREVVREFVQGGARADLVAAELREFLKSPEKRNALRRELAETTAKLGGVGAHRRAAEIVAGWLAKSGA